MSSGLISPPTLTHLQTRKAGNLLAIIGAPQANIDGLIRSLEGFKKSGTFPTPPSYTNANGQQVVKFLPYGLTERFTDPLALTGCTAELYLQPGKPASQGHFYTGVMSSCTDCDCSLHSHPRAAIMECIASCIAPCIAAQ
jgi:hypothetical protein